MKAAEIKAAFKAQGLTYSMIVEANNQQSTDLTLTVPYLSSVINRCSTSKPVAEVIAKTINKPIETVFPELFTASVADKKREALVNSLSLRLAMAS
jgi:hypothetical protein